MAAEKTVLTSQGELVTVHAPLCYAPQGTTAWVELAGKAFTVGKELLRP